MKPIAVEAADGPVLAVAGRVNDRGPLREEHSEATRARILEATLRVMASGLASVTIPAVAREASVSIPTVYRHFRSKPQLLDAVYPYLERRAGLNQLPIAGSIEELAATIRAILERLDTFDDLARSAMTSPAAEEARGRTLPRRLAMTRRLADSIPDLSSADRDRIARLLVIVTSSAALRTWRDHVGLSVDEVVSEIEWLVSAAIEQAKPGRSK